MATPLVFKKLKHYLYHVRRFLKRSGMKFAYTFKKLVKKIFPAIVTRISFNNLKHTVTYHYGHDIFGGAFTQQGINVSVITRGGRKHPTSSTFIRLISPLAILMDERKVNLRLVEENTVNLPKGTDIVIVQRTAFDSIVLAKKFVKYARKNNIGIIVDSDDNFRSIDTTHPEYYIQKSRIDSIDYIKHAADQIWFSTEALSGEYADYGIKRRVVPNSVDPRIWKSLNRSVVTPNASDPLQIVYMGTATHGEDFKIVLEALDEIQKKAPDSFKLTVIGVAKEIDDKPWIERLFQPKGLSLYPRFVEWFISQGPFDIGLAPLVNSRFNKGKSDIKALDYISSGIIPVVSDVLPYQSQNLKPHVIKVKNTQKAWVGALQDQINNRAQYREDRVSNITNARSYITAHRRVDATADKIYSYLLDVQSKK